MDDEPIEYEDSSETPQSPQPPRDLDIGPVLDGWEYAAGEVTARIVENSSGEKKLQMRVAMGLLQMELEGRPDGRRPHGHESLLVYHRARMREYHSLSEEDKGFKLGADECEALREEAYTYYYRYLCLFHLKDFSRSARDTARNLQALDFMKDHAQSEGDSMAIEQYRPYIMMMNARARAYLNIERGSHSEAIKVVEQTRRGIREFYREIERQMAGMDAETLIENSGELKVLEELLDEVRSAPPAGLDIGVDTPQDREPAEVGLEHLRKQLRLAVDEEDYERAAGLRDQIRQNKLQDGDE